MLQFATQVPALGTIFLMRVGDLPGRLQCLTGVFWFSELAFEYKLVHQTGDLALGPQPNG